MTMSGIENTESNNGKFNGSTSCGSANRGRIVEPQLRRKETKTELDLPSVTLGTMGTRSQSQSRNQQGGSLDLLATEKIQCYHLLKKKIHFYPRAEIYPSKSSFCTYTRGWLRPWTEPQLVPLIHTSLVLHIRLVFCVDQL